MGTDFARRTIAESVERRMGENAGRRIAPPADEKLQMRRSTASRPVVVLLAIVVVLQLCTLAALALLIHGKVKDDGRYKLTADSTVFDTRTGKFHDPKTGETVGSVNGVKIGRSRK